MKIYANWSLELTKLVLMHPDVIFSLIKWQSTLMCLVLSWKIGFDEICEAV